MPENTTKKISTELELDISSFSKNAETAADKTEELQEEIDSLKKKLSQLGTETDKTAKKGENALNKIIPKFLGFAAVTAVIRTGWKNIVELDQSVASLNFTLGESSQIVQDFADKYSTSLNMGKKSILEFGASFSTMLGNILDSQETIANVSTNIIAQIDKITSVTGRSAEDISKRYESLIRGNLSAFRDLGIDTRKEYLMTSETFKRYAGDKSWEELTRNQQTQIALIETMNQVNDRFGEGTDSIQGKLGKLQSRWENLTTSAGALLALATPLLDFGAELLEGITDGIEGLGELGEGAQVIILAGVAFVAFAPKIISRLKSIFTGTMSTASGFMLLGGALLSVALLVGGALKKNTDDATQSQEEYNKAANSGVEAIEDETEATKELDKARQGLIGIDEINTMSSSGSGLSQDDYSMDRSSEWVDDYIEADQRMQDSLDDTIEKMGTLGDTFSSTMTIIAAGTGVLGAFTLASKLVTWVTARQTRKKLEATQAELAKTAATKQSTVATTQETAATQKDTVAENVNTTATKKATISQWLHNASLATKIGLVKLGIGAIGIVAAAIALGTLMSSKANDQPRLARGGVVNQATSVTVGEGTYHEAVVPLGNSPEWNDTKEDLAEYLADNSRGQQNITTVVNLNDREIVRAVSEPMYNDWRKRGWLK